MAGTVPITRFAPLAPVVQPIIVEQPDADPTLPPTTRFASLEAAVEAQSLPSAMADDLECLAGAVFFESKGEPLAGQLAVAQVVINRAESGRFPRSVCSVVTQPGQFSFVRGGRVPSIDPARRDWKVAVAVAQIALADAWHASPAPEALFFHARHLSPRWNKARVATIGNHVFYR